MTDTPGYFVKITQDMMIEFVENHTGSYEEEDVTLKKDLRAAFVKWLHLNHNRYEKDITNATAAAFYGTVFECHDPFVDEAIDANGNGVFLRLALFDPGNKQTIAHPPPTPHNPNPQPTTFPTELSQWTHENLTEYTSLIFQQIAELNHHDQPHANILLNLLGRSIIQSHLNTQGIYLSLNELRDDLRSCLDELVEEHVEFQTEELKRRFDRVLDRHTKQINKINEWRNRFDDAP